MNDKWIDRPYLAPYPFTWGTSTDQKRTADNRLLLTAQQYHSQASLEVSRTLSDTIREHEAKLIGELARKAHAAGKRFVGWPTTRLMADDYRFAGATDFRIVAEVWCE